MLIVLGLYGIICWLIFSKLRLLPWNGLWKGVTGFLGLIIALVVIGALNFQTPSGSVSIQTSIIDITPNVAGPVTEVSVSANMPVAKGDLLFKIDQTRYQAEVTRLEASLVEAQATAQRLKNDFEASKADIMRLQAQLRFGEQRRDDIVELANRGASAAFQMEEAVSNIEQLEASLRASRSQSAGIAVRLNAQVDGVDAAVAQAQAALESAIWNLEQTEIRAPSDGVVTALALQVGNRVTPFKSAIAFVPDGQRILVGLFPQAGAHGLKTGDAVSVALRSLPGTSFMTTIASIPPGSGEGGLAATGAIPSVGELLGSSTIVVRMDIPENLPDFATRIGVSGSALRITDDVGAIEPLAHILFWVSKMMNYL